MTDLARPSADIDALEYPDGAGPRMSALAAFATGTRFEDLPAHIVEAAKMLLIDSIGCALGGVTTDPGKLAVSLARRLGGPPECTIIGVPGGVSITNAVLANGQLVNALDFDTVMPGGHTPPYIVPTVLAMAEAQGASGRDLITATAIALEISARFAKTVPPAMRFEGPERTLRYPTREGYARLNFGAAAGAGRLLGLTPGQMMHALGLAGHLSQLNTWARQNHAYPRNLSKYGFAGWQNTGAVLAVLWAEMGHDGDVGLLDDDETGYGALGGYDDWKPHALVEELGERWNFDQIRFKPYACCTMLHRAIECFESILDEHHLRPEEIDHVTAWASPTVESELFLDRSLNNVVDLQFGIHNVFAMVVHGERTGADWQDWEKLTSDRIQDFAAKVELRGNPDYGTTEASAVEVVARGATYRRELAGMTEPLGPGAVLSKFRHNAQRVLTQPRIDRLAAAFESLEMVADVRSITADLSE